MATTDSITSLSEVVTEDGVEVEPELKKPDVEVERG